MKRESNMRTLAACGIIVLSTVMVLVSIFLNAIKDINFAIWEFMKHNEPMRITWVVLSIVMASVLLILAIIMILDAKIIKKSALEAVAALIGVGLIGVGIAMFMQIPYVTGAGVSTRLDPGIGLILNLVFSIIGGIAAFVPLISSMMRRD